MQDSSSRQALLTCNHPAQTGSCLRIRPYNRNSKQDEPSPRKTRSPTIQRTPGGPKRLFAKRDYLRTRQPFPSIIRQPPIQDGFRSCKGFCATAAMHYLLASGMAGKGHIGFCKTGLQPTGSASFILPCSDQTTPRFTKLPVGKGSSRSPKCSAGGSIRRQSNRTTTNLPSIPNGKGPPQPQCLPSDRSLFQMGTPLPCRTFYLRSSGVN